MVVAMWYGNKARKLSLSRMICHIYMFYIYIYIYIYIYVCVCVCVCVRVCVCVFILLSSPYLLVFGDDRVRGTREQMM